VLAGQGLEVVLLAAQVGQQVGAVGLQGQNNSRVGVGEVQGTAGWANKTRGTPNQTVVCITQVWHWHAYDMHASTADIP
jgi:hypothetical protein